MLTNDNIKRWQYDFLFSMKAAKGALPLTNRCYFCSTFFFRLTSIKLCLGSIAAKKSNLQ